MSKQPTNDEAAAKAYYNCGRELLDLGRPGEALECLDRAISLRPDSADFYNYRGIVLKSLGRFDEAVACYDQALKWRPFFVQAFNNRGNALKELGRIEEALASYKQAVTVDPGYARGHHNLALCHLLMGDFARGWQEYEWRWKEAQSEKDRRELAQPLWLGNESLAGKTIFLHYEQGLGDTLQFCRYAKLVSDQGARVLLDVPNPLLGLLRNLDGVAQLFGKIGDPLREFDYHCPLMSLPLAFRTELPTIPAPDRYISSEPDKVVAWQSRLDSRTKPRVGLAWSGNPRHGTDHLRSIDFDVMRSLLHPEFEWFSLHREVRDRDAEVLASSTDIHHFGAEMDFVETAAVIELMDLVISVDTSIAHLAGAMGKPVWILLPIVPDWRWLLDREDSPWYLSARLFRQDKAGDWCTVVKAVHSALSAWRHA
jgi:Tfp pilus assembly protein PilF